jgi:aspartate/methionine/tyrosine aminotransferase
MQFSNTLIQTQEPPIMAAFKWIDATARNPDLPLLNLSQAAPADPPPAPLRAHLSKLIADDPSLHAYGPVLGNDDLRAEVAARWSVDYHGHINPSNIAITSGCNQAFCAAINTVAAPSDAVILVAPWYFNHKMHLDMQGIETRVLTCDATMLPSIEAAEKLLDSRVKAIVLVTPNNPTGAEYPDDLITQFADLAKSKGISLILDETYRDFHSSDDPPHTLFADPDWTQYLIHLYSFSKVFRLTGHRVGALVAGTDVLDQVEKYLDTVSICANQTGQRAALFGLQNLKSWVDGERAEIFARRDTARASFGNDETELLSCGAYFAYLKHPWDMSAEALAKRLLSEQSLLVLPGSMFMPSGAGAPELAEKTLRIAFANVSGNGIVEASRRIAAFKP